MNEPLTVAQIVNLLTATDEYGTRVHPDDTLVGILGEDGDETCLIIGIHWKAYHLFDEPVWEKKVVAFVGDGRYT